MLRRVLILVLLATQVATTLATPALVICISPKGHVCIETIWNDCQCCEEEDCHHPCLSQSDEEEGCECCAAEHAAVPATSEFGMPMWNGKPCPCQHIPLVVEQPSRVTLTDRSLMVSRLVLDWFPALQASVANPLLAFNSLTYSAHHPPPAGHLLLLSCIVLRC